MGVEYYLSGVKEEKGYYEFTFDYILNNTPVFINYNSKSQDKALINNAVTITANSKRVINCWWLIKKFTQGNETGQYYVDFSSFISLLDNMFQDNESLNFKNFSIEDISVSYEVKSGSENQSLEPVWVITTKNNDYYAIPMRKKKGD